MKTLIIILLLLLTACSGLWPADGKFVCIEVGSYKPGMYEYRLESAKGSVVFYTVDSANKYTVGDTIYLTKNPVK